MGPRPSPFVVLRTVPGLPEHHVDQQRCGGDRSLDYGPSDMAPSAVPPVECPANGVSFGVTLRFARVPTSVHLVSVVRP